MRRARGAAGGSAPARPFRAVSPGIFRAKKKTGAAPERGAAMIVVAGLVLAFVLIAVFSNRATRGCRWREYPRGGQDSRWVCAACGAETRAPRGKAPGICLGRGGKK